MTVTTPAGLTQRAVLEHLANYRWVQRHYHYSHVLRPFVASWCWSWKSALLTRFLAHLCMLAACTEPPSRRKAIPWDPSAGLSTRQLVRPQVVMCAHSGSWYGLQQHHVRGHSLMLLELLQAVGLLTWLDTLSLHQGVQSQRDLTARLSCTAACRARWGRAGASEMIMPAEAGGASSKPRTSHALSEHHLGWFVCTAGK